MWFVVYDLWPMVCGLMFSGSRGRGLARGQDLALKVMGLMGLTLVVCGLRSVVCRSVAQEMGVWSGVRTWL